MQSMKDGFLRVAAVSPALRVADCAYNAQQIIGAMQVYAKQDVQLLVFPELCVTGYTCGDLFLQRTLRQGALAALREIVKASEPLNMAVIVGLPVQADGKLYNCAAIVNGGRLCGLVPKRFLPNYAEFYELRHFASATSGPAHPVRLEDGAGVQFGTDILFDLGGGAALAVEICEDLWAPVPPSCAHALAGATVIANLSASDETVGKAEYRRALVQNQSARLLCAYVYADAGHGESTTDMTFAGHDIIAENGTVLAESAPFGAGAAVTEVDIERLTQERVRSTSFVPTAMQGYAHIAVPLTPCGLALTRAVSPAPFVPQDDAERAARCQLILRIQAEGLARRMEHTGAKCAVMGISGGLDSCLALLAAVRACRVLGRPADDVTAITMPCFGTTGRTRSNAEALCRALGVTFEQVDIAAAVRQHFADIKQDPDRYDVTFENAQARMRTLVLMDWANRTGGLVVGTGDLSELALGWATYNGDHMSMYGVNAGVPKTLVRHIVRTVADTTENAALRTVLLDILDTPVSPELLPAAADGSIAQQTEQLVGPYELHDFFLYYVLRHGFAPRKIYRLARVAFAGQYADAVLLHWLKNFYRRFFAQQFKRSCLPDGPKVGSVTLSPRGDWRMPSDASAALWLAELETL